MANFIKIKTFTRDAGRQQSRATRIDKRVPAVVYGPKTDNKIFSISIQDSIKYSASRYNNEIFELQSEDKQLNSLKVLCKSTSIHPTKRDPLHMDFYALNMKENITVDLTLIFEGLEELQKNNLEANIAHKSISIECSPADIPESVIIDLSVLSAGSSFTVEQLNLKGIKILTDLSTTLASVAEKKEEIEEVVSEAVSPADTPASADAKTSDEKKEAPSENKASDNKKDGNEQGKKS
ncbi:MAG: 50S ribosomal protein L25 [Bdellovibrionaceae bacterium]|nr:50S ribosomal protein L25 [Pseudobdellovibrionaceae bacterium]